MLNYLRADFYRVMRSRVFIISVILLAAISVVNVFTPINRPFPMLDRPIGVFGAEDELFSDFVSKEIIDRKSSAKLLKDMTYAGYYWDAFFRLEAEFEYAKEKISKGEDWNADAPDNIRDYYYNYQSLPPQINYTKVETDNLYHINYFVHHKEIYLKYDSFYEYAVDYFKDWESVLSEKVIDTENEKNRIESYLNNAKNSCEIYKNTPMTDEQRKLLITDAFERGFSDTGEMFAFEKQFSDKAAY